MNTTTPQAYAAAAAAESQYKNNRCMPSNTAPTSIRLFNIPQQQHGQTVGFMPASHSGMMINHQA
jgi:hypothetical protein